MPDTLITSRPPIKIGATGLDAILQNIGIIVTTLAFSVPLDRSFASTGTFIDAPSPYVVAKRIAELTEVIESKEPRVRVTNITYEPSVQSEMDGSVYPRIFFEIKDGVTL